MASPPNPDPEPHGGTDQHDGGSPTRAAGRRHSGETKAGAWHRPPSKALPPAPALVPRVLWRRVARQVEATLRLQPTDPATLRAAVRQLEAVMRVGGASAEEVREAVQVAVREHPDLATLDRRSVMTQRLVSELLLERMLEWIE